MTGFPHSDTPGSPLACSSPRLFAARRVLHRLFAPRHPPYTLSSLTRVFQSPKIPRACLVAFLLPFCFFLPDCQRSVKIAPGALSSQKKAPGLCVRPWITRQRRVCKTRLFSNVVFFRFPVRKEVIQPQVLLQLPCYDFTPIMNHTFGACLPCGLARRLLVQPTFVM